MFEKFSFGSYRIDDSELANIKNSGIKLNAINIQFLDGSSNKFNIDVIYHIICRFNRQHS